MTYEKSTVQRSRIANHGDFNITEASSYQKQNTNVMNYANAHQKYVK